MNKEYITQQKKTDLETELNELKTVIRPAIIERVASARALGDLSENAEYHTSREQQSKAQGRIDFIEDLLKRAVIVERTGSSNAEMGASVTFKKIGTDITKTYTLVSVHEADLETGKIAITSPIGSAMIGKSIGEQFTVSTPAGETVYEIIDIQ